MLRSGLCLVQVKILHVTSWGLVSDSHQFIWVKNLVAWHLLVGMSTSKSSPNLAEYPVLPCLPMSSATQMEPQEPPFRMAGWLHQISQTMYVTVHVFFNIFHIHSSKSSNGWVNCHITCGDWTFLHSQELSVSHSPRRHRSEALRRPARWKQRQAGHLGTIDPCPGGRVPWHREIVLYDTYSISSI